MKRKQALWLVVALVIVAVGFYLWGSSSTPPGQPPLISLSDDDTSKFQQSFNAAISDTRIVLLLSPT